MPPQDQPPKLGDLVRSWIFRRFGIGGLVLLALGGVGFYLWSHWSDVRSWPGVSSVAELVGREALPKADPQRFSVAVARLEGDEEGAVEQLVLRLLRDLEGVQILSFDRVISTDGAVPEDAEKDGHRLAHGYLEESGASVLIWGGVLRHDGQAIPDLYLTAAPGEPGKPTQYKLESETEFRLPKLFWDDLSEVLQLVIAARDATFQDQGGRYIADRLRPFIARVRSLLDGGAERPGWDRDALASTRLVLAGALTTYGEQTGERAPLEEAVAAYRAALEQWPRERVPLDWAKAQSGLGSALQILGAWEGGTTRLEEAVAAYRAALEEQTRARVPLDWARTQNNLGNALRTLGEREDGTARLEEAVAAYRAALEVRTRERAPLDWATTQNNLGTALQTLGTRENSRTRLEEAVAAYRSALEAWDRERAPLNWAMTQNNLGAALYILGTREGGTAHLEEAVVAYRAALEELIRERVPLNWATTQTNLGNALQELGEQESGSGRLVEAVAAYRAALEERTRERVPLGWAATQNNLGNTLRTLGEREGDKARIEEAVAAYRGALEVFEAAQVSDFAAVTRDNLRRAQASLTQQRITVE